MAEASAATELVGLFEKASKAADRAVSRDGVVMPAEETRCKDALERMGEVEVSTSLLFSTQVRSGTGRNFVGFWFSLDRRGFDFFPFKLRLDSGLWAFFSLFRFVTVLLSGSS